MFYENTCFTFQIQGIFYVERCARDVQESNRLHTAISFRLKGCSTFLVQGKQLHADTGAVTYIPAGIDYRHINEKNEKIIILHLHCPDLAEPQLQIENNVMELEPLFRTLLEVWEEGGPSAYNRSMSLLYHIFERLQQKKNSAINTLPAAIAPGVEMLRKNFRNPRLTVSALAASCFVSEVYFRKMYRSFFGESPLQTILNLRFQYACSLLGSGYYTCKQTAELAGFSDVKYFRTAFKKRYGQTPKEFAQSNRMQ